MASRLEQLRDSADAQEEALQDVLGASIHAARTAWLEAGNEAADYVRLIARNNPTKTFDEILERSDVQQALSLPFKEARTSSRAAVHAAWAQGVAQGRAAGLEDMAILGLTPANNADPPATTFRASILSDVDGHRTLARTRFRQAVQDGDLDALTGITNDLANRSALSTTVAGHRSYNSMKLKVFEATATKHGLKVRKIWITRFRPTTCRTCAALHGTIVSLPAGFPATAHIGPGKPPLVYGDLIVPPRHPNCGCRIVPYIAGMEHDKGLTLALLRAERMSWAAA